METGSQLTGSVVGDERYIPWPGSREMDNLECFTLKLEAAIRFNYTPSTAGSHTIMVTFQLQTWDGTQWNDVSGTTDTETITSSEYTGANAGNNNVSLSSSSVTAGGSATITAVGDRQSATVGNVEGDERYIPTTWSSSETGKSGIFTLSGNYTSDYTPSTAGSYTITVAFQLYDMG